MTAASFLPFGPAAGTARSEPPCHDTAGSGPPERLRLAVTALAPRPVFAASLMPATALILPIPASASVRRLLLSLHMSPSLCLACTSMQAASCVGCNPGDQRLWRLPAFASLGNCGPALALRWNCGLSLALLLNPLPALALMCGHLLRRLQSCLIHPMAGQMPELRRKTEGLPGDLECCFAISSRFRLKYRSDSWGNDGYDTV